MKICYFGTYNAEAARNQIIIKGLRENGVEVVECHSERPGARKYIDLLVKYRRVRGTFDLVIVGFPGYKAIVFAKLLTRKPVVFDAFVSSYDSIVLDRQQVRRGSMTAYYYWLTDWLTCRAADLVLLDTYAHIEYFVRQFNLPREKFRRVLVGTDPGVFFPMMEHSRRDTFLVHFHGTYIPLQGIEYILDAAKRLENENITFRLLGSGQTKGRIDHRAAELGLSNVTFLPRVPYAKLNTYLNTADVALGIFGATDKARRVIPNKVYEALATGVPVITGDSPAVREVFADGEHLLTCPFADGEALAEKILILKNNPRLRADMARRGRERFLEVATPQAIGRELAEMLRNFT